MKHQPTNSRFRRWLYGLLNVNILFWLFAPLAVHADDSKFAYVFAEIKVYSGPYNGTLEATYISDIFKIPADGARDFKTKAKERVQILIQGKDQKIGGDLKDIQVIQAQTATDADDKRDQTINEAKSYPYSPGNIVKLFKFDSLEN